MKTLTTEQIKARLQEVGMTQKQLAEKLEMQPARLSEMINGKKEMPVEVEEKIMDSLNVHEFPSAGIEFQDSEWEPPQNELDFDSGKLKTPDGTIINAETGEAELLPYPERLRFQVNWSLKQQLIDLIQSRRYLGLRHKKRLIEDLKGLEL